MKLKNSYIRMILYALSGAFLGLFFGFIFGMIIYGVGFLFFPEDITNSIYNVAPFFGMGFGSVIGAIMSGFMGLKK